jgi:hypothetical protein
MHFYVITNLKNKNAVVLDVMQCVSCKNRRFGGMYVIHHQSERISEL